MSPTELRASLSLTALYALRMLGLFLILPVFAVHAAHMPGGDDHFLIGVALGIYGLTQAILQVPFGMLSDRIGRKRVIVPGLLLFVIGSLVAAAAPDLEWIIVGRALQGAGAISSVVTALLADLTSDRSRVRAMAMVGASIGLMFALSMMIAPLLYQSIGMSGIFILTGVLGLGGVAVTIYVVPDPPDTPELQPGTVPVSFKSVALDGTLLRLNFGIFALHLVLMSVFVVVPSMLVDGAGLPLPEHWKVYLPVVLASFVLMVPLILVAERGGRMKSVFLGSIATLAAVLVALILVGNQWIGLLACLVAFFTVFNVLEASLPSLVSRLAPMGGRGTALGIYNTTQALGLFAGGAVGGALRQGYGAAAVFAFSTLLVLTWLLLSLALKTPAPGAARAH